MADKLTGLFSLGLSTALVPTGQPTADGQEKWTLITLPGTGKIPKRAVERYIPLEKQERLHNLRAIVEGRVSTPQERKDAWDYLQGLSKEERDKHLAELSQNAIQKLADLWGPRGLALYRALQRELWMSKKTGHHHKVPTLGDIFFCSEDRILRVLYPGGNYQRTEHVREYRALLDRITSKDNWIDSSQFVYDGKSNIEIKVSGPPLSIAGEIELKDITTNKPMGRGAWLIIKEAVRSLFDFGGTNWHAWGDVQFLSMERAIKMPTGTLIQDWIENKLQIDWNTRNRDLEQGQGKGKYTLDTILADIGRRDHYLYPEGDISQKPRPAFRKNALIKGLLNELDKVSKIKEKSGLWSPVLIKDPDAKDKRFKPIPDFLKWLKNPEGRKALKLNRVNHHGENVQGGLRFVLYFKIGPAHNLNKRHTLTPKEKEKRIAARRRRGRHTLTPKEKRGSRDRKNKT